MQFWVERLKKFCAKIKILKFKIKDVLLGTSRLRIGKNDCDIWNQHPKICQNKKKLCKTICGPKMPYLSILGCTFEKLLRYFQHPRICQNGKFCAK